jgi:hypothetical protein
MIPMWVLDHLDDLESDFSAVHGIENMYDLPSRKFLAMAMRISAYEGVMSARLVKKHEAGQQGPTPPPQTPQTAPQRPEEAKELPSSLGALSAALPAEDGFPAVFEVAKGG